MPTEESKICPSCKNKHTSYYFKLAKLIQTREKQRKSDLRKIPVLASARASTNTCLTFSSVKSSGGSGTPAAAAVIVVNGDDFLFGLCTCGSINSLGAVSLLLISLTGWSDLILA